MVRRANRRIGSKTARAMLGWSHYRFKQRLLNKTREYPWCKVIICDEHYTSKTCGNCGHLHMKLGSSKTFKCPQCHVEMDRDINAARNILLRYLTLNRASLSGLALGLAPLNSSELMQDLDKGAQI
jgi:putative transposase